MLHAIRAQDDRIRSSAVIPLDVQEIVTGSSDEIFHQYLSVTEVGQFSDLLKSVLGRLDNDEGHFR
jgi:hypothetical protein